MNQTELKKILNKKAGRSKYGNHKVHCLSKHLHDSKLEANYCNRLLAMLQAVDIVSYKVHKAYPLVVNNVLVCNHIVDFEVVVPGTKEIIGNPEQVEWCPSIEVHDTKGMKTDVWRIKHKLFQVLYPTIKYVVVSRD